MLAVGQPEQASGALAQVLGQRVHGGEQPVDGDGVGLPPGDQPVGERPGAGQRLVQAAVGGGQDLLVDPGGAHPVAGLDLVGVADGLAGQLAGPW